MEGDLQVVDLAEGVLLAVCQVHEEDTTLGGALVFFAVRLRAKVTLPVPPFLLHLCCCETAKARLPTLRLAILRGGARGASAGRRAGAVTRGFRCRGAVDCSWWSVGPKCGPALHPWPQDRERSGTVPDMEVDALEMGSGTKLIRRGHRGERRGDRRSI